MLDANSAVMTELQLLLKWIIENEVYVHFMAMNNLYFGIVDIIDSLVDDTKFSMLLPDYINFMKNTLYKYINADIDYIHSVFLKYNYPNIQSDNVQPFCEDFIAWIENINVENEQEDFGLESVRQLLKASQKKENLCFLSNNEDLILMDGYESLYIEPIYMFPYSQHIFNVMVHILVSRVSEKKQRQLDIMEPQRHITVNYETQTVQINRCVRDSNGQTEILETPIFHLLTYIHWKLLQVHP